MNVNILRFFYSIIPYNMAFLADIHKLLILSYKSV